MCDQKGLLKSTTAQGAALAGIPAIEAILIQLGILHEPVLTPAITAVVSGAGALLALWGRIKANKFIKGLF